MRFNYTIEPLSFGCVPGSSRLYKHFRKNLEISTLFESSKKFQNWFPTIVILFTLIGLAFLFYATLIPERFFPGIRCQYFSKILRLFRFDRIQPSLVAYAHSSGHGLLAPMRRRLNAVLPCEPRVLYHCQPADRLCEAQQHECHRVVITPDIHRFFRIDLFLGIKARIKNLICKGCLKNHLKFFTDAC